MTRNLSGCAAVGCVADVRRGYLMCPRHWRQVPRALQDAVWAAYRPEQLDDLSPGLGWWEAAATAVEAVARLEGKDDENRYRSTAERLRERERDRKGGTT